jgi:hypothetical protein
MAARIRRFAAAFGLTVTLLATLPTGAMAECNGPTCAPPEAGVDGIQGAVFVAILVVVGAATAIVEARQPRS